MTATAGTGVFAKSSVQWNTTNLKFLHHLGGCCVNEQIEELPPKYERRTGKYPIPAEETPDFTEWAFGTFAHNITMRPLPPDGACCDKTRDYLLATDLFGPGVGSVRVNYPCCWQAHGCYLGGFMGATVEFRNGDADAGVLTGTLKRSCCFLVCGSEEKLTWDTPSAPYMSWKRVSALDQALYSCCCEVWTGWRGSSSNTPEGTIAYDQSFRHRLCAQIGLSCANMLRTSGTCCSVNDSAWRFGRSEDIRQLIATRYDWELARRKVDEDEDFKEYNLREGNSRFRFPPAPAHEVCALYTARLYHDVTCTCGKVRWANSALAEEGGRQAEAAVDVRYRGSLNHEDATDDDHLVALAGLVINAINTFPLQERRVCFMGFAQNIGPLGNVSRGRLVSRDAPSPHAA